MLRGETQEVRVTGTSADYTPAVESTKVDEMGAQRHNYQSVARLRLSCSGTRLSADWTPEKKRDEEVCTNGRLLFTMYAAEVNNYVAKSFCCLTRPSSMSSSQNERAHSACDFAAPGPRRAPVPLTWCHQLSFFPWRRAHPHEGSGAHMFVRRIKGSIP